MDHHVRGEITEGLRRRGIDVLTAAEDGSQHLSDPDLLTRATSLGRVLFTNDAHHLAEAKRRQQSGESFAGVIYAHQLGITIGQAVEDLELIAQFYQPEDLAGLVQYLPL
jgi:hypothetical protein